MTQVDQVRRHLEAGKSITPASAMAVYGIFRLASCIEDLRNSGMEIDTVMKADEMGKQYGEYFKRRPIAINTPVQVKAGHGVLLPSWVRTTRAARVIAMNCDAAFVRFTRGTRMVDLWLNEKELVNAL